MGEIKTLNELKRIVEGLKSEGKKIVFTNGCFDILHLGHIRYLRGAKKLGDVLIVGLNSDESVQALKGEKRPIMPQEDRAEILASLSFVDYVVLFHELTPVETISALKPQIHVKGGDYKIEELPEAKTVKSYGGEVVILPEVKGKSTKELIAKIVENFGCDK